jgi:hypothetical protein
MKNDEDKKQITNLVVNTIFIFNLQMSCNSARFGMQRFKDDMLGILVELVAIFIRSLGIFAQSSELWANLIEKLIHSIDVFSQSTDKWA